MTRPRDNGGLMSRLPDDDAYWGALADRLVLDAAGRLRAHRRGNRRWWLGLSRLSTPITLAAAASVVAALLWLPEVEGEGPDGGRATTVFGLAPTDPLADRLVGSPTAPTMATLIVPPTPEASP